MMPSLVRVAHLSVVHKPDDPRIMERECRTLAQAGYDVAYLAPGARAGRDPSGVLRTPLPPRGRATRFLDVIEITRALRASRPHVVHVHDPELLSLFPVLKPFVPRLVYDMHEYVPEAVASKHYIPPRMRPLAGRATAVAQRGLAGLGSGVVVVTDEQLASLGAAPRARLVLPNYPRVERFADATPVPELAGDPRLKLIYVGSLSRPRGCTIMLDVMEQLAAGEAVLYLGGTFAEPALETEVRERLAAGLDDRVRLLGRIPPPELPGYLAAADAVWVPSQPNRQYTHPSIPTKLLEGMAMGLTALVSDLRGRGELVKDEGCGFTVPPTVAGHVEGVHQMLAARDQLATMGARGRLAVNRRYSWEAIAGRFVAFYESLCAGLGERATDGILS
jgi:glycosyltransferase involved in cell wall biosynthesis